MIKSRTTEDAGQHPCTGDPEATLAYDGSFPGFLCACAEALNAVEPVPRVVRADMPESLFEARITVLLDHERAIALWKRMAGAYGAACMRTLLEAFLSDIQGADAAISRVLLKIRRAGATALDDLADPDALTVEKASYRARMESHKFCGLVRFSQLSDGSWYAPVEPDCDVLLLIADHFSARYNTMRFAIHDRKRGSALLHETGMAWSHVDSFSFAGRPLQGTGIAGGFESSLSDDELAVRALWKTYFESVAVEGRTNPKLQRNFMPKKYWNLLTEMGGRGL
jgi:probable DNA metabolism protein